MRYDSFLLRRWQRESESRIEVSHLQSGGHIRLATLSAVTAWIDAQCAPLSERDAAVRISISTTEMPPIDQSETEAPRGCEPGIGISVKSTHEDDPTNR